MTTVSAAHRDVARFIKALGPMVGNAGPDELPKLLVLGDAVTTAMIVAVQRHRDQGYTWEQIAAPLGVTKQAVIQRYGPYMKARSKTNAEK